MNNVLENILPILISRSWEQFFKIPNKNSLWTIKIIFTNQSSLVFESVRRELNYLTAFDTIKCYVYKMYKKVVYITKLIKSNDSNSHSIWSNPNPNRNPNPRAQNRCIGEETRIVKDVEGRIHRSTKCIDDRPKLNIKSTVLSAIIDHADR